MFPPRDFLQRHQSTNRRQLRKQIMSRNEHKRKLNSKSPKPTHQIKDRVLKGACQRTAERIKSRRRNSQWVIDQVAESQTQKQLDITMKKYVTPWMYFQENNNTTNITAIGIIFHKQAMAVAKETAATIQGSSQQASSQTHQAPSQQRSFQVLTPSHLTQSPIQRA